MGRWVLVAVVFEVEEALVQGSAQVQVRAREDVAEGVEVVSAWESPAAAVQGWARECERAVAERLAVVWAGAH